MAESFKRNCIGSDASQLGRMHDVVLLWLLEHKPTLPEQQMQQAYFISITDNGDQGFGQEFFLTTFGAGSFGSAFWSQLDLSDPFTYSLVPNPNQSLEPIGSRPFTGQYITLDHVGVAAGASLAINLLIQVEEPNEVKKLEFPGLVHGKTLTAGEQGSATPL